MSKVSSYNFGSYGNISITTGDISQSITTEYGVYQGFAITNVSGTFNGETVTALKGAPGADQRDTNQDFQDNAIFVNSSQGDASYGTGNGSLYGIDSEGIGF